MLWRIENMLENINHSVFLTSLIQKLNEMLKKICDKMHSSTYNIQKKTL